MNRHIKKMPIHLSNKIAAGEVVDRPSSVIKELVENSIDSGATQITIEISDAGRELIRVIDNGSGIHEDDIPLIFERHATSKIYEEKDIDAIATLGFRGEALASIAAVSKVTLLSKQIDSTSGFQIRMIEGTAVSQQRVAMSPGTTLSVEDLFFNAPARLKFLKSKKSENTAITQIIHHLAIANPSVAFRFVTDGQIKMTTPGDGEVFSVLYQIYGRDMSEHMVTFHHSFGGVEFEGFITDLNYFRGTRSLQSLYVNNRYIQNAAILDAVNQAYKALIPIHQFPVFFIMMTIDPSRVDVNIHPNKMIIKIEGEQAIAENLQFELREGLYRKETHVRYVSDEKTAEPPAPAAHAAPIPVPSTAPPAPPQSSPEPVITAPQPKPQPQPVFDQFVREDTLSRASEEKAAIQEQMAFRSEPKAEVKTTLYDDLIYIGQALRTYLIFEKEESIYLLDQHAAHEKILYETFMKAYREGTFDSQLLLAPEMLSVSQQDMDRFQTGESLLARLGYDIETFGQQELILRGIPTLLSQRQAREMLLSILDLVTSASDFTDRILEERIIQKSCKKAIKAHDTVHAMEAEKLLLQLKELDDPLTCPHGRPVIVEMSQRELEKIFKR